MAEKDIFARLHNVRRIWAIGSIHGEIDRLRRIHRVILDNVEEGDRVVYLGNFMGRGPYVRAVIDEMLRTRRLLMAMPNAHTCDVVFLRGSQEEMWQKVLQLQFATNPREVYPWILNQGVGATIAAYGGDIEDGYRAVRDGTMSIARWTNALRQALRASQGHSEMMTRLKRAALTDDGRVLLVNAGLDITRPLTAQRDSFWWGGTDFAAIDRPYGEVHRVVRGFDRAGYGLSQTDFTLTLDGGSGRGGTLLAAALLPDGRVESIYEA